MKQVRFRKLNARQELAVQRDWPALLPELLAAGLAQQDAQAIAYNASFLYYGLKLKPPAASPGELLDRFSLAQLARLCEAYAAGKETLEALDTGEVTA